MLRSSLTRNASEAIPFQERQHPPDLMFQVLRGAEKLLAAPTIGARASEHGLSERFNRGSA
jgi:hypothetical protein